MAPAPQPAVPPLGDAPEQTATTPSAATVEEVTRFRAVVRTPARPSVSQRRLRRRRRLVSTGTVQRGRGASEEATETTAATRRNQQRHRWGGDGALVSAEEEAAAGENRKEKNNKMGLGEHEEGAGRKGETTTKSIKLKRWCYIDRRQWQQTIALLSPNRRVQTIPITALLLPPPLSIWPHSPLLKSFATFAPTSTIFK